jgi:RHS repeat-associated protein
MYTAWVEAMYEYNAQSTSGSFDSPYRFNGKELDKETGYGYYGARHYQSKLSMWLSVDPLAHKYPNMSPYAFTGNNPVMLVDPDGNRIISVHGTWSNVSTWKNTFGITQACHNLFGDNQLAAPFPWVAGNFAIFRTAGANSLIQTVRDEMQAEGFNGQITLVGHSHGGNLSIEALNMMVEMEEFSDVKFNLLTINTPVRGDYQLSDKAKDRVNHVNVYDPNDPVQENSGNLFVARPSNTLPVSPLPPFGEYGPAGRKFGSARNIETRNSQSLLQGLIENFPLNLTFPLPFRGDFHNSHNRVSD